MPYPSTVNLARWPGRPVWAEIDLDAVAHNVRLLAERAAPARLYAVVKANAYGHGAVAVARAAVEAGAAGLAVACVDEARELRDAGIGAPILLVGQAQASEAQEIVALGLTPTLTSMRMVCSSARPTTEKDSPSALMASCQP